MDQVIKIKKLRLMQNKNISYQLLRMVLEKEHLFTNIELLIEGEKE